MEWEGSRPTPPTRPRHARPRCHASGPPPMKHASKKRQETKNPRQARGSGHPLRAEPTTSMDVCVCVCVVWSCLPKPPICRPAARSVCISRQLQLFVLYWMQPALRINPKGAERGVRRAFSRLQAAASIGWRALEGGGPIRPHVCNPPPLQRRSVIDICRAKRFISTGQIDGPEK